jgi:8-oxo-dGTP diphosphatase
VPVRVVAGLIYQGDRVLACQRKEGGSFPLKWEFPGGKVENGEDDLATLRRELKEELGIEVQSAREVFRHSHSYPDQIVDLIFFKIEIYRGSVSNKVFERVRWLNVKDLKELDFLEGDLPLIEKLISGKLRV